jgi:hypothetical protein
MEAMTISPDEDIDDMSSVDDLSDEDEAWKHDYLTWASS